MARTPASRPRTWAVRILTSKSPLILNYTAGIERQLGQHLTVGANYAGSVGHSLPEV